MTLVTTTEELLQIRQTWQVEDNFPSKRPILIPELRKKVAFVPTMGNLHSGHLELVKRATALADHTIVSIFVNPLQFNDPEDFKRYQRTLKQDYEKLSEYNVDLVFAPSVNQIYPNGLENSIKIVTPHLVNLHCAKSRPGHFMGVATVLAKLFNLIQPHYAIFGEKDYQQLLLVKHLVEELSLPIEIHSVPTKRHEDGLAMSSRNNALSVKERETAPYLFEILKTVKQRIEQGEYEFRLLEQDAEIALTEKGFKVDYFNIAKASSLEIANSKDCDLVILAAAYLGQIRLIDNIQISF